MHGLLSANDVMGTKKMAKIILHGLWADGRRPLGESASTCRGAVEIVMNERGATPAWNYVETGFLNSAMLPEAAKL